MGAEGSSLTAGGSSSIAKRYSEYPLQEAAHPAARPAAHPLPEEALLIHE